MKRRGENERQRVTNLRSNGNCIVPDVAVRGRCQSISGVSCSGCSSHPSGSPGERKTSSADKNPGGDGKTQSKEFFSFLMPSPAYLDIAIAAQRENRSAVRQAPLLPLNTCRGLPLGVEGNKDRGSFRRIATATRRRRKVAFQGTRQRRNVWVYSSVTSRGKRRQEWSHPD